ncbi:uncharacterized protein PAC_16660 [Phialocephala subalpina]|uniref:BTB domain-containing protein n=1 Tax=Phialocephala subalpina TaxID=576137 RepID=A0A1L7XP00_9HELO|nr:uncharacterized protein PAC_16660 [Phialocephala subalpina]
MSTGGAVLAAEAEGPLFRQLGDGVVTLVVGEDKRTFTVHKKKLCEKIPHFKKMFNVPFQAGQTQSAKLPEDNPGAIESMLGWVYLDRIEVVRDEGGKGKHIDLTRYLNLYSLAEKYGCTKLADLTMDFIAKETLASNCMLSPLMMKLCYDLCSANSKLRLFAARCFAYCTLQLSDSTGNGTWSSEKIHNALWASIDLSKDYYGLLRSQSGKAPLDPRSAFACDYHQHAKTEMCPYNKKRKTPGE